MLRISILSTALALNLLPACATDVPDDELAGESSLDDDGGKADGAGAFTFFHVTRDIRACNTNAGCGGFFVSRIGRASTVCGRLSPSTAPECHVDSIDWSGTALPDSVARGYEQQIDAGTLILRGEIAPDPADRGASLAVTEVWVAGSETGVDDGVAVLVKDNNIRCFRAPCPSLTETRLNSSRSANITDVDLTTAGADEATIERASNEMFGDDGVIVIGDRFYGKDPDLKGRRANQFYLRAPVPQF